MNADLKARILDIRVDRFKEIRKIRVTGSLYCFVTETSEKVTL
jgi:hypothetical protein